MHVHRLFPIGFVALVALPALMAYLGLHIGIGLIRDWLKGLLVREPLGLVKNSKRKTQKLFGRSSFSQQILDDNREIASLETQIAHGNATDNIQLKLNGLLQDRAECIRKTFEQHNLPDARFE